MGAADTTDASGSRVGERAQPCGKSRALRQAKAGNNPQLAYVRRRRAALDPATSWFAKARVTAEALLLGAHAPRTPTISVESPRWGFQSVRSGHAVPGAERGWGRSSVTHPFVQFEPRTLRGSLERNVPTRAVTDCSRTPGCISGAEASQPPPLAVWWGCKADIREPSALSGARS